MTTLGREIRKSRRQMGWSIEKLAEEAGQVPGAPEISADDVGYLERCRLRLVIDDEDDCLPWVLKALGMDGGVVLKALRIAA